MKFSETMLQGVFLVEPERKQDERGFFSKIFCVREFEEYGLNPKINNCCISFNKKKGTLRGMHYQADPSAEDKLVSCLTGKIFDVAVDIRPESPSYRRWFGVELSAESHRAFYIPNGFAHGFITLTDDALVHYHISNYFDPNSERGLRWDDPAIGIRWPIEPSIISKRDLGHPLL